MPAEKKPFAVQWKGKQLRTMGEIFDAAIDVRDQDEAGAFLAAYVASGLDIDTARSNLGYFAGYYSEGVRVRVAKLYKATHPVFGDKVVPTPEEAFAAGGRAFEAAMKKKPSKDGPKHGDLKVWWIPQVPGTPFEVPVPSLTVARLLLNVLAEYDKFQLEHNIKPDYCNAGGVMVFDAEAVDDDGDGWEDWSSKDGDEFDRMTNEQLLALDKEAGRER